MIINARMTGAFAIAVAAGLYGLNFSEPPQAVHAQEAARTGSTDLCAIAASFGRDASQAQALSSAAGCTGAARAH